MRDKEIMETLKYCAFGYWFLIDNLNKQFGVTRENVISQPVSLGYESELAEHMVNEYEEWAKHVVRSQEHTSFEENL